MIDTHCHILPGIDDGARDMSESLAMVKTCVATGVSHAVCTPHLTDDPSAFIPQAKRAFSEVRLAASLRGIRLDLGLGYEVDLNLLAEFDPASILSCTFGFGRPILLLETPYAGWPRWADRALFDLRLREITPILAHPERNEGFQRQPERLSELARQGVVLQITVPSLLGQFGRKARDAALRHLSRGEAALLASDVHYGRLETATLQNGAAEVRRLFPHYPVERLVEENPRRLLAGHPLLPPALAGRGDRWTACLRKRMR
ncbi:MAG: hypothetical protein GXX83_05070 [Gaiellales bacterium]|nr:hypothetical protein [Gaiellales bacterium]